MAITTKLKKKSMRQKNTHRIINRKYSGVGKKYKSLVNNNKTQRLLNRFQTHKQNGGFLGLDYIALKWNIHKFNNIVAKMNEWDNIMKKHAESYAVNVKIFEKLAKDKAEKNNDFIETYRQKIMFEIFEKDASETAKTIDITKINIDKSKQLLSSKMKISAIKVQEIDKTVKKEAPIFKKLLDEFEKKAIKFQKIIDDYVKMGGFQQKIQNLRDARDFAMGSKDTKGGLISKYKKDIKKYEAHKADYDRILTLTDQELQNRTETKNKIEVLLEQAEHYKALFGRFEGKTRTTVGKLDKDFEKIDCKGSSGELCKWADKYKDFATNLIDIDNRSGDIVKKMEGDLMQEVERCVKTLTTVFVSYDKAPEADAMIKVENNLKRLIKHFKDAVSNIKALKAEFYKQTPSARIMIDYNALAFVYNYLRETMLVYRTKFYEALNTAPLQREEIKTKQKGGYYIMMGGSRPPHVRSIRRSVSRSISRSGPAPTTTAPTSSAPTTTAPTAPTTAPSAPITTAPSAPTTTAPTTTAPTSAPTTKAPTLAPVVRQKQVRFTINDYIRNVNESLHKIENNFSYGYDEEYTDFLKQIKEALENQKGRGITDVEGQDDLGKVINELDSMISNGNRLDASDIKHYKQEIAKYTGIHLAPLLNVYDTVIDRNYTVAEALDAVKAVQKHMKAGSSGNAAIAMVLNETKYEDKRVSRVPSSGVITSASSPPAPSPPALSSSLSSPSSSSSGSNSGDKIMRDYLAKDYDAKYIPYVLHRVRAISKERKDEGKEQFYDLQIKTLEDAFRKIKSILDDLVGESANISIKTIGDKLQAMTLALLDLKYIEPKLVGVKVPDYKPSLLAGADWIVKAVSKDFDKEEKLASTVALYKGIMSEPNTAKIYEISTGASSAELMKIYEDIIFETDRNKMEQKLRSNLDYISKLGNTKNFLALLDIIKDRVPNTRENKQRTCAILNVLELFGGITDKEKQDALLKLKQHYDPGNSKGACVYIKEEKYKKHQQQKQGYKGPRGQSQ